MTPNQDTQRSLSDEQIEALANKHLSIVFELDEMLQFAHALLAAQPQTAQQDSADMPSDARIMSAFAHECARLDIAPAPDVYKAALRTVKSTIEWMGPGAASNNDYADLISEARGNPAKPAQDMTTPIADDSFLARIAKQQNVMCQTIQEAAQWNWLKERFTGYDFYWGGAPNTDNLGSVVAVFEVGQEFKGGRDIAAAIDRAIAASQQICIENAENFTRSDDMHTKQGSLYAAVQNLIKVKGRHNTETAYTRLVAAFDAASQPTGSDE